MQPSNPPKGFRCYDRKPKFPAVFTASIKPAGIEIVSQISEIYYPQKEVIIYWMISFSNFIKSALSILTR
jgi:hypothetical protein